MNFAVTLTVEQEIIGYENRFPIANGIVVPQKRLAPVPLGAGANL